MDNAKNSKAKEIIRRSLGIGVIPLLFIVGILITCLASGRWIFSSMPIDLYTFTRYTAILFITTLALSINLGSGRFDFSLGAISTLSAIISAKITYAMLSGGTGSALVMLIVSIIVGALLGLLSGAIYVVTKLPPIITSLGVTLIYEGIAFVITEGASVKVEVDNASMTYFNTHFMVHIAIILVVLAVIYLIFDRRKFGFQYSSLRSGQKISVNTGIKEIPNALICYAICGGLMGIVGLLQTLKGNTIIMTSSLNFGSIGIMFSAFLPMFIGGYIGRYSNDKVGYLIASICMSLLASTFALFNEKTITSSVSSIVSALLLVLFLIFLNNEQTCLSLFNGTIFKNIKNKIKIKAKKVE